MDTWGIHGRSSWSSHVQVPPLGFGVILTCNYQEGVGDNKEPGPGTLSWYPWPPEEHYQNCCFGVPALSEQLPFHALTTSSCPTRLI